MQHILKKTLLAVAIAATASVNAAEITANGGVDSTFTEKEYPFVSYQGLTVAETISIGTGTDEIAVSIETESDYQETDLLILTITGAVIEDADSIAIGTSNFELLGVDTDAGTITLRPSTGSDGVDAGTFALSGIVLEEFMGAVSLSSRGVTVQGIDIDAGKSTQIAVSGSEFTVKADTKFNATVDVEEERKEFTDGTTDNFTVSIEAGADLLAVTPVKATIALTGEDLDFLNDEDGELDDSSYELDGLSEDDDETTFVGNTLTLVSTGAYGASAGVTLTADGSDDDEAQTLTAQSFSADVELDYTAGGTAGSISTTGISVGAWDLSGATVNVPYMPYGNSISQIVYLSNDGSVEGDIELTAFDDEGNQYGPVMLSVTATANTVTSLAQPIRNALLEEGFDGTGRIDFTLVVNSPASDVSVYGAYNVAGDRATVPVL